MTKQELTSVINEIIVGLGVDPTRIYPDQDIRSIPRFYGRYGEDFLDLTDALEMEFDISFTDKDFNIETFQQLYDLVAKKLNIVEEEKKSSQTQDVSYTSGINNSKQDNTSNCSNSILEISSKLKFVGNGDDCLVYPNIGESVLSDVRLHFSIDRNETIILVRDTSFWNSRDQGLVITDQGLYCIPDNENVKSFFYVDWGEVEKVEYQESVLYFITNDGEQSYYNITYFAKNVSNSSYLGLELAKIFTQMASCVSPKEDPVDKFVFESRQLAEKGNVNEAVTRLNNVLDNVDDSVKLYIYYNIADILYQNRDYRKAIENCNLGLDICEPESYGATMFKSIRFSAMEKLSDFTTARKDCLDVMRYASDQKWNGESCKQIATNKFNTFEKEYSSQFLLSPYNERKVLMPVKEYVDLKQNRVSVIRMDNLPAIKFPMGHPIANQLYVGHPLIPSKYIPFDNYQLELVEDKVREFCMLAQSLGATEISIECLNASASNESGRNKQDVSGEAGNKMFKGKGEYHQDRSSQLMAELSHSISLHQTFTPFNKPSIPEDMVWYEDEPSWQRLASQRMNGGLLSHEERIETRKSQMVEGRELTELKAEVNSLYVDMKMSISEEEEAKFTQQENAVLAIKVKFAPLSQLTGEPRNLNNHGNTVSGVAEVVGGFAKMMSSNIAHTIKTVSSLTSSENEYLTELKDILTDGEISARERRLLEKIRVQLGISEDRAAELENSLTTPCLTPEEQEYFDEYKEIIAEGVVSDRDKRFLEKLKTANGISDERAKEIEDMVGVER